MSPSITLHHLQASRSERIVWALEELNLPYNVQVYLRGPDRKAPASLFAVNPIGKAPFLVDGDVRTGESAAIVQYLLHKTDPSRPFSLADTYWAAFGESLMVPLQLTAAVDSVAAAAPEGELRTQVSALAAARKKDWLVPEAQKLLNYANDRLGESKTGWFSDRVEPGAGDFVLAFPLRVILTTERGASLDRSKLDNLNAWWEKVQGREAYQRASKRLQEEETKAASTK